MINSAYVLIVVGMHFKDMFFQIDDYGHFTRVLFNIKISRQHGVITLQWDKCLLLVNNFRKDMLGNFTSNLNFKTSTFLLDIFQKYCLVDSKPFWIMGLKWWFKVIAINIGSTNSKYCISKWDINCFMMHIAWQIWYSDNVKFKHAPFIINS